MIKHKYFLSTADKNGVVTKLSLSIPTRIDHVSLVEFHRLVRHIDYMETYVKSHDLGFHLNMAANEEARLQYQIDISDRELLSVRSHPFRNLWNWIKNVGIVY